MTTRQRFALTLTALIVLGAASCARPSTTHAQPQPATDQKTAASHRLDGVWRMVANRDWQAGSPAPGLADIPKEKQTHLKFITAGHFIWYTYDPATKAITESMSGTCVLNGSAYQETVEYGSGSNYAMLLGTASFTVKTDGGRMHLSGTLKFGGNAPTTLHIEEVWERVK